MSSIRNAYERREEKLREAEAIWSELAEGLSKLIPSSMTLFAAEHRWPVSEIDNWWKLPEFLQFLVENTRAGGCNDNKFQERDLPTYGFSTFEELETGLRDLERAWSGLVRIKIDKDEGYRWQVRYYAAEFVPTMNKN